MPESDRVAAPRWRGADGGVRNYRFLHGSKTLSGIPAFYTVVQPLHLFKVFEGSQGTFLKKEPSAECEAEPHDLSPQSLTT